MPPCFVQPSKDLGRPQEAAGDPSPARLGQSWVGLWVNLASSEIAWFDTVDR